MWMWLLGSSLVSGSLPTLLSVAGGAGMGLLLGRRERGWWARWVPSGLVIAVLSTAVLNVLRPFPDALSVRVLTWIAVAMFGLVLTGANLWLGLWWRRLVAVPAVLVLVAMVSIKINAVYQYRLTLASALGLPIANEVPFDAVPRHARLAALPPGTALAQGWRAGADMPRSGKLAEIEIPGTVSRFSARPGWVYLPPAYLSAQRPLLPVLVLIAGQPGWPADWFTAGHLAQVMDSFAASHRGLAPVVVVPDATGSALGDPLCMDSALGRVQTYLALDVPAWVRANLQVSTNPRAWAVGGFSYGGTCALQLAVNAPDVYPTFLDISGDDEPTLGSRKRTVAAAFGGNDTAFRSVNPIDVLSRSSFPLSAGRLVIGNHDGAPLAQGQRVITAARRAGMDVELVTVPGAHTWPVAGAGLSGQLNWLAQRLDLLADPAASGESVLMWTMVRRRVR